jgi:hypothetical protein
MYNFTWAVQECSKKHASLISPLSPTCVRQIAKYSKQITTTNEKECCKVLFTKNIALPNIPPTTKKSSLLFYSPINFKNIPFLLNLVYSKPLPQNEVHIH